MSVVITGVVPSTQLPRILWDAEVGTVTASSEAAGYDAAFADSPVTYTSWRPVTVPASWTLTLESAAPVDSCGISCHSLGSSGASVTVEYLLAEEWTSVGTLSPTDDNAILFLFPEVDDAEAWRILVEDAVAEVGVVMFGKAMVLPVQSRFAPELPITEAENLRYNVNLTDSGSWAGRSVVQRGLQFSLSAQNVPESFASSDWASFRRHANEGPATFFIAPKPAQYPKEVAYAWSTETVSAPRGKPNHLISREVELSCTGYLP